MRDRNGWIRMEEEVEMSLETKGKETNKDIVYEKKKRKNAYFYFIATIFKIPVSFLLKKNKKEYKFRLIGEMGESQSWGKGTIIRLDCMKKQFLILESI